MFRKYSIFNLKHKYIEHKIHTCVVPTQNFTGSIGKFVNLIVHYICFIFGIQINDLVRKTLVNFRTGGNDINTLFILYYKIVTL